MCNACIAGNYLWSLHTLTCIVTTDAGKMLNLNEIYFVEKAAIQEFFSLNTLKFELTRLIPLTKTSRADNLVLEDLISHRLTSIYLKKKQWVTI